MHRRVLCGRGTDVFHPGGFAGFGAALLFILAFSAFWWQVLWTTSIWLESVAIVPQLVLLQQMREVPGRTYAAPAAQVFLRVFDWLYIGGQYKLHKVTQ